MVNRLKKVVILITLGITGVNSLYSWPPPGRAQIEPWVVRLLCPRHAAPGYQPIPQDVDIEAQEQGEPIPQDNIEGQEQEGHLPETFTGPTPNSPNSTRDHQE